MQKSGGVLFVQLLVLGIDHYRQLHLDPVVSIVCHFVVIVSQRHHCCPTLSHTLTTHDFWKVPPCFRDWIVVKGWNTLSWKFQRAVGLFHWSVLIVLTYSLWVTLILWHLNDTWSFHQHCDKAKPLIFKGQPCQEFQFYGRLNIRQNSPWTLSAKSSALIGFPMNLRFMLHNCWTILHASTVMNKLLQKHSFLMTSRKHNQLSHVLCNELVLFHRKLKEISPSIFDGSMRRKMLQRKWNKSQKRRCSVLWNTSGRLDAIREPFIYVLAEFVR